LKKNTISLTEALKINSSLTELVLINYSFNELVIINNYIENEGIITLAEALKIKYSIT